MYPSAYGYVTVGDSESSNLCLAKAPLYWSSSPYKTNCAQNSWLFDSINNQWTLIPSFDNKKVFLFKY